MSTLNVKHVYTSIDGICRHLALLSGFIDPMMQLVSLMNNMREETCWLADWMNVKSLYLSGIGNNIEFLLSRTTESEQSLLGLCTITLDKLVTDFVTEVGQMKQRLFLIIWSSIFHRERPITTGKQMLMRHLTFNSIALPLHPLLLCGITVSSTGKTGSLVEDRHESHKSEKTHTLTKTQSLTLQTQCWLKAIACYPVILCIYCRKELDFFFFELDKTLLKCCIITCESLCIQSHSLLLLYCKSAQCSM